jgi:hypothetical protein
MFMISSRLCFGFAGRPGLLDYPDDRHRVSEKDHALPMEFLHSNGRGIFQREGAWPSPATARPGNAERQTRLKPLALEQPVAFRMKCVASERTAVPRRRRWIGSRLQ